MINCIVDLVIIIVSLPAGLPFLFYTSRTRGILRTDPTTRMRRFAEVRAALSTFDVTPTESTTNTSTPEGFDLVRAVATTVPIAPDVYINAANNQNRNQNQALNPANITSTDESSKKKKSKRKKSRIEPDPESADSELRQPSVVEVPIAVSVPSNLYVPATIRRNQNIPNGVTMQTMDSSVI